MSGCFASRHVAALPMETSAPLRVTAISLLARKTTGREIAKSERRGAWVAARVAGAAPRGSGTVSIVLRIALVLLGSTLVACSASVEQAPVCARYTACIRALDEVRGLETDLDRFDPGGACWGSEEGGVLCERACTRGLVFESSRGPNPPQECRP